MTKKEFITIIKRAKKDIKNGEWYYICHALDCHYNQEQIVELYKEILKPKRDSKKTGFFGYANDPDNQFIRMISLDLFEQFVISEKLYEDL